MHEGPPFESDYTPKAVALVERAIAQKGAPKKTKYRVWYKKSGAQDQQLDFIYQTYVERALHHVDQGNWDIADELARDDVISIVVAELECNQAPPQ